MFVDYFTKFTFAISWIEKILSNMEQLKKARNTTVARIHLHEEANALRIISSSDFTDPVKIQQVVTFMDGVGAAGEPAYAVELANMLLLGLASTGEATGNIATRVLFSSATNNWLAGNTDSAMLTLEQLLKTESLDEEDIVRAASVKARIIWSQGQKNESVEFLKSVLPRLTAGSEAKARTALLAAQYSGLIHEYGPALSLVETLKQEISLSGVAISVATKQLLEIQLAWISLNFGNISKAMVILEESTQEVDAAKNPRLYNFKAYVTAWCTAARSSQPLGDAIRDADSKFTYDPSIGDSQHTIAGAWAKVQTGDILGAHNLFLAAAKAERPASSSTVVLNFIEAALEGVAYTASVLGRDNLATEALTELQSLQSNGGFTVSVSGLVHGTALALNGSGDTHARLQAITALRRRGQFTQDEASILVVRCMLAECQLLQEAGLSEQEIELRDYCKSLMASTGGEKTKIEFENELRIATLTATLGDASGAAELFDEIVPDILSLYGTEDELVISARYARAIVLDTFNHDSASLDVFKALQRDIESVFGGSSIMNLKAQYSTACSLERAGDSGEALSVLLALESNAAFKTVSEEFRQTVISKVADLFFMEGRYSRAINWYKLITRLSFQSTNDLTQREFHAQMMHGQAKAKAGRFEEARSHFEIVLAQEVSADPINFDMMLDGRVASAACAESLGQYSTAAEEYLSIVLMVNGQERDNDLRLWDLNISIARNYELADDQVNAFLHYEEALGAAQTMSDLDDVLVQEILWRRECCRP